MQTALIGSEDRISPELKEKGNLDDQDYEAFIGRVRKRFRENCKRGPLFRTNISGEEIWNWYLSGFEPSEQKYHNCKACKHFITRYGGLVTIDEVGRVESAVWHSADIPQEYYRSIFIITSRVLTSKIQGVFLSETSTLGIPVTNQWTHMSLILPGELVYKKTILDASQREAQKAQDFQTVWRALSEYSLEVLNQAVTLLEADTLYRSEKVLGPVKWLRDLKVLQCDSRSDENARTFRNKLWRAVALAPDGFCHPRSAVTSTLLDDLIQGLPFEEVKRRWEEKMHPLQYQRPQAAPTEGNIKQAEEIVAKLGIARSLERRFARLDEIETIWKPTELFEAQGDGSVFGHLLKKEVKELETFGQKMTWVKFRSEVLPKAKSIQYQTIFNRESFTGILTAVHVDAPSILKWDSEDRRNPFSWYLYHGGSTPETWALPTRRWVDVTAVTLQPDLWFGATHRHFGESVILILKGCVDTNYAPGTVNMGACLFPEILRGELHGVRSTIEAHSRKTRLQGYEQASACGLMLGKDANAMLRVHYGSGIVAQIQIDRWD